MTRRTGLLIVLLIAATACDVPDVALDSGSAGGTEPAAARLESKEPPTDAPFVEGTIVSVMRTRPVTTDCMSETDLDPDSSVSSDDPPICNPQPDSFGSIHVKGEQPQGGETEIVATVAKSVPILRPTDAGAFEPVDFAELQQGDAVSLWITGPVAESYPLQGAASFVVAE